MSTEPQKVTLSIVMGIPLGLHWWAFFFLVAYAAIHIADKTPLSPPHRAAFEHVAVIWAERARLPAPRTATCFDWRCTVSAGEPPTLYSVSCAGWSDDSTCLLLGAGR